MAAFRRGDRNQILMQFACIAQYVKKDAFVCMYDAFIESKSYSQLDINIDDSRAGNREYDPKIMFKIFLYGYSIGVRSCRKLESMIHNHMEFIWLAEGLHPDHKTIARFRQKHLKTLAKLLKQSVELCITMKAIEGNHLFTDATKMRGNCSSGKFEDKEDLEAMLKISNQHIDELMKKSQQEDKQDCKKKSLIIKNLLSEKLFNEKLNRALEELNREDLKEVNITDPHSRRFKSREGSHCGTNFQSVVDGKYGLIVSVKSVKENNDIGQVNSNIELAEKNTGKKSEIVCADSGYHEKTEMGKLVKGGRKLFIPSPKVAHKERTGQDNEFDKDKFVYDEKKDEYICPQGKVLRKIKETKSGLMVYQEKNGECKKCKNFGTCTKSKNGREVRRFEDDEILRKIEADYKSPEGQRMYKRRQFICETPHGHIKHNEGMRSTSVRGEDGADAEYSLAATCYNLRRLVTIFGMEAVIAAMWA
jgi:transposase